MFKIHQICFQQRKYQGMLEKYDFITSPVSLSQILLKFEQLGRLLFHHPDRIWEATNNQRESTRANNRWTKRGSVALLSKHCDLELWFMSCYRSVLKGKTGVGIFCHHLYGKPMESNLKDDLSVVKLLVRCARRWYGGPEICQMKGEPHSGTATHDLSAQLHTYAQCTTRRLFAQNFWQNWAKICGEKWPLYIFLFTSNLLTPAFLS